LDAATGLLRWAKMLRRFADASPIIAGDDVWVAATDGRLYRFALADGTLRWQYEIRGAFHAAPVVSDGRLLVANDDGTVIAFGGSPSP
jgi:outer membrane protein assembly factor BamB